MTRITVCCKRNRKNKFDWTGAVGITKIEFPAAGKSCKAVFCPTRSWTGGIFHSSKIASQRTLISVWRYSTRRWDDYSDVQIQNKNHDKRDDRRQLPLATTINHSLIIWNRVDHNLINKGLDEGERVPHFVQTQTEISPSWIPLTAGYKGQMACL